MAPDLPDGLSDRLVVQPLFENISFPCLLKSLLDPLPFHPDRGAYRDRHGRGVGCDGRGSVGRANGGCRAGFLVSDPPARGRTAIAADGKAVWSRHPLLVSSLRRFGRPDRVRQNLNPLTTVTRRIRRRGEREISR
jgi:hypothetical protein